MSNSAQAFASAILLLLGCGYPFCATAQSAVADVGIEGTWQGTLHYLQKDMRTVLRIKYSA